jgi:hypothetical protein
VPRRAVQIDAGDINATVSADGTVAFADDAPVRVSKAQMDAVLARAQAQERHLRALEREMARSKEYLSKVRARLLIRYSSSPPIVALFVDADRVYVQAGCVSVQAGRVLVHDEG